MKKHIRTDTIKLFEDDVRILGQIMQKEDFNKSQAWRFALKNFKDAHTTNMELSDIKDMISEINESLQQLYFKLDYLNNNKKEVL